MQVGNDIIEISRIKNFIEKHGDACKSRIFSGREWNYCFQKANPYPSFAARFAAKEAVAKALGTGFGRDLNWNSIEILNEAQGAPYVELDAKGRSLLNNLHAKNVKISLSHCKDFATAVAIIE